MMKLAYRVFVVGLAILMISFAAFSQTDPNRLSEKDNRNTAPTVGTGGPMGGPTGLFTVYDGKTLRRGEHTLSAAYSNYDRDPGDVDITEVPLSFQIGVSNYLELFFNIDGYRGVKVNSPRHLSGFYLPNSQLTINNMLQSGPAIILAPSGPTPGPFSGMAVFRPTGMQPFVPFPYVGGNSGTFGLQPPFFSGPLFGFPAGTNALMGPPTSGGVAANFPGIGSVYGSILPGFALTTFQMPTQTGALAGEAPGVFTLAPAYLPDAPFLNRTWGTSSFSTFTVGAKWRWTNPSGPVGIGIVAAYRGYLDKANSPGGFNMLQRGASPGGNRGDILLTLFADARLARWANLSANVGYHYNGNPKGDFPSGTFTLLDRPDELLTSVGIDFPVNKYFQPIAEFRALRYVGGRTPNAFENHPMDAIGGFRVFPTRWFGIGLAYRYHVNQQDRESFDDDGPFTSTVTIPCTGGTTPNCQPVVITSTFRGVPTGFRPSENPHGFIFQTWIGRRNSRQGDITIRPADVTSLTLSQDSIVLPCAPGFRSESGGCNDPNRMINVTTTAVDPDGGISALVYNYTVSGGRIVGSGSNVQWDLDGLPPGTYTITSAVDNGCGFCGATQTRTVTISDCPDCRQICDCPSISVTGPAGITNPGENMTFIANISGGPDVTIRWEISGGGRIIGPSDQRTLTVGTSSADAGRTITATLNLDGLDPECRCQTSASDSGPVREEITPIEIGDVSNDEVRAVGDLFISEMANNPNDRGHIIIYGTPRQIANSRRLIENHFRMRRADTSRVTITSAGFARPDGVRLKFYRVPEGAMAPRP
jgi:hypothetical protein